LWTLAEHEAVVPVNESHIAAYLGSQLGDSTIVDPAALGLTSMTLRRLNRDSPQHFLADSYRDVWAPVLERLIDERLLAQASRHPSKAPLHRRIVVVKEPNGSEAADLVMELQPAARLLFLLRDGRDVVDSELAALSEGSWVSQSFPGIRGIGEDERLEAARRSAYRWKWRTEVVQAALEAHQGPKMLVRYGDLREEPVRYFGAISRWLGLPDDEPLLKNIVERHDFEKIPADERGPNFFYRAATPGLWAKGLRPREQAVVTDIIGETLKKFGYAVTRPPDEATVV
jgi:hypothetical protein